MASLLPIDHFTTLFQTGFLINAAYLAVRIKFGSPVSAYVKTERDVRLRLKPLSNEEVKSAKARLTTDMRQSETLLRFFLRLATVSQYGALIISFVLLLMAAFNPTHFSTTEMTWSLIFIFAPIPLSMITFASVSFFYLGQLERDIMKVAQAANALDEIKEANRGADRSARINNAIEHLENTLGGRR